MSQPIANCIMRETCFAGPIGDTLRLFIKGKKSVATIIAILIIACIPFTIIGIVVSIVILAFECQIRTRARPEIGEKVGQSFSTNPSFTYRNTTAAIVLIARMLRVKTPLKHCIVDVGLRRTRQSMRSIRLTLSARSFALQASAGLGVSRSHMNCKWLYDVSAIA